MAEFPLFHFERVPIRDQTSQQLRQDTEINIDLNMNLDKKKLQKNLIKKISKSQMMILKFLKNRKYGGEITLGYSSEAFFLNPGAPGTGQGGHFRLSR